MLSSDLYRYHAHMHIPVAPTHTQAMHYTNSTNLKLKIDLGWQRQGDLWGLLASQPSLTREP